MNKIEQIIYLPTVRCNLNCQHCGEQQDILKDEELDCIDVLKELSNSIWLNTDLIEISGGEPFLNSSIYSFILTALKETEFRFHITSNGWFTNEILELIDNIEEYNRDRLSFSISIDGNENLHNKIRRNDYSYQRAIETVRGLSQRKISVGINIVVQEANIYELKSIEKNFRNISDKIQCSFIPIAVDISENKEQEYLQNYIENIWEYLKNPWDKKNVLSKGKFRLSNCHAGERNIVIAPNGNLYSCIAGAFYKDKNLRRQFYLGDLKERSLDEILLDRNQRNNVRKVVKDCEGCSNPCEIIREFMKFNLEFEFNKEELEQYFNLENKYKIGDATLGCTEWYEIEGIGKQNLCWSRQECSKIYIKKTSKQKYLDISYIHFAPKQNVKFEILINNIMKLQESILEQENIRTLSVEEFPNEILEVKLCVNKLLKPKELIGNGDDRDIGIGINNIKLY